MRSADANKNICRPSPFLLEHSKVSSLGRETGGDPKIGEQGQVELWKRSLGQAEGRAVFRFSEGIRGPIQRVLVEESFRKHGVPPGSTMSALHCRYSRGHSEIAASSSVSLFRPRSSWVKDGLINKAYV